MALAYATTILVARWLGPMDYGLYAAIVALLAVTNFITLAGPGQAAAIALHQGPTLSGRPVRRLASSLQAALVVLLVPLFLLFIPLVATRLGEEATAAMLVASLSIPAFGLLNLALGLEAAEGRLGRRSLGNIAFAALRLLLTALALVIGFGGLGAIAAYAVAALVPGLILLHLDWNALPDNANTDQIGFRSFLGTSSWSVVLNLAAFSVMNLDILVVSAVLGPDYGGLYAAVAMPSKIPFFLAGGLQPSILAKAARSPTDAARHASNGIHLLTLVWLPALAQLALFQEEVVVLLFGQAFAPGAGILGLVAVGVTAFSAALLRMTSFFAAGRPRQGALVVLGLSVLALGAITLGVMRGDLLGAGLGMAFAGFAALAVSFGLVHFRDSKLWEWKPMAIQSGSSVLGAGVAWTARMQFDWGISLAFGLLASLMAVVVLREPTAMGLLARLRESRTGGAKS
jgi:O-antigen/teichoic acid export membrane protein